MDRATLSTRDETHSICYRSMLEPLVGTMSGVNVLECREGLGLGRTGRNFKIKLQSSFQLDKLGYNSAQSSLCWRGETVIFKG